MKLTGGGWVGMQELCDDIQARARALHCCFRALARAHLVFALQVHVCGLVFTDAANLRVLANV